MGIVLIEMLCDADFLVRFPKCKEVGDLYTVEDCENIYEHYRGPYFVD